MKDLHGIFSRDLDGNVVIAAKLEFVLEDVRTLVLDTLTATVTSPDVGQVAVLNCVYTAERASVAHILEEVMLFREYVSPLWTYRDGVWTDAHTPLTDTLWQDIEDPKFHTRSVWVVDFDVSEIQFIDNTVWGPLRTAEEVAKADANLAIQHARESDRDRRLRIEELLASQVGNVDKAPESDKPYKH